MKQQLTNKLDQLIGGGKPKEIWAVYYKLNIIVFPSKKSSWSSIGAAKKAVKNNKKLTPLQFSLNIREKL